MKFDHVGIVVPSMAVGRERLAGLLGMSRWSAEFADPVIGVYVQFGLDPPGICSEIISPLRDDSPVSRTLKVRDRILNHVAYLVSDLDLEAARLTQAECMPAGPANPAVAYSGKRVQSFISPLFFILELIEAPDHAHDYSAAAA